MYNAETLLDIHARGHESLRRLIVFCGTLTDDELRRPLPGFGFPTVLRQLEHTIGAEVYWQTVVIRGYSEEATLPQLSEIADIETCRQQTASVTRAYLGGATEGDLNSARQMINDPGQTRLLRPADVIMRVVTHIFNHQGQVLAMCRTMGKPNDKQDLDYPVD
ncbi:MAG TPA: DinB family protein [Vicinamibacterales bacterium]